MKIIQRDEGGEFELLIPLTALEEQLWTIEKAARVCYHSHGNKDTDPDKRDEFLAGLLKRGHESVFEHSLMIVRFWNVSRGFTHELVRHRLCGFSQRSTRYVNPDLKQCDSVVMPPQFKDEGFHNHHLSFSGMAEEALENYKALIRNGWKPEDARQILPIGIETEIVVSANFRQWRHIFELRCAKAAQWEIRRTMCHLLLEVKSIPVIFDDFWIQSTNTGGRLIDISAFRDEEGRMSDESL